MAGTPVWKVYDSDGVYVAACKHPEAAACLVGSIYGGGTVRWDHKIIVWREPTSEAIYAEGAMSAADSYDEAARIMYEALAAGQRAVYDKAHGRVRMVR